MFFIPLILTAGLDLSLPEFQPELDASGNYIVAEYDDFSGVFEVQEVRELPNGLTEAALAQDDDFASREVLYNRDGSISSSVIMGFNVSSSNFTLYNASQNEGFAYIPVTVGYTYSFTSNSTVLRFVTQFVHGAPVTNLDSFTFTPSQDGYVFVWYTWNLSATYVSSGGDLPSDPSGNDPSGNDPTPDNPSIDVSGVVSELQVLHDELSMKLRIIIFVLIWQFIMPLAMKIRDHIFNLKHD